VHNGIIENYLPLRRMLEEKGHHFSSETDTESLVHLISHYYQGDILQAVTRALKDVEGYYAIGVICGNEPGRIIAARKDNPLVVGLGRDENFIASDIPAFLPFTRSVLHVKDGEVVELTGRGVRIFDLDGNEIHRKPHRVDWDDSMAEKSGFKHFMLKEIFEQPRVISDTLSGRLREDSIHIDELKFTDEELRSIGRILITACGTALHAGMVGRYFIEEFGRVPVDTEVASELRYRKTLVDDKTLVMAISQSGETTDTISAFRELKKTGARSMAVTNVVGSSITRETDHLIFTRAGLEIGVAATKTFTAQLVVLCLFGLKLGMARGHLSPEEFQRMRENLLTLPDKVSKILGSYEEIRNIARRYHRAENVLYLGRNVSFPVALEGALKLKEISYMHAEGLASGEMKHGPIALIDGSVPVISILPNGPLFDKSLANLKEVKARSGMTIGVINEGSHETEEYLDEVITVPETDFYLSPVLTNIPLQLLAYFMADRRKKDVDQPRNLAKSVTVE